MRTSQQPRLTALISISVITFSPHLLTSTTRAGPGIRDAGQPPLVAFHHGAHWRSFFEHSRARRRSGAAHFHLPPAAEIPSRRSPLPLRTSNSKDDGVGSAIEKGLNNLAHMLGLRRTPDALAAPIPREDRNRRGRVARTASKSERPDGGSLPSSRAYTTRKEGVPQISVSSGGVLGDYNHYRTAALGSTSDRAISILTSDVNAYVNALDGGSFAKSYGEGDLGENVLVDGVDFDFFEVGGRYAFGPSREGRGGGGGAGGGSIGEDVDRVVIEITEPMEPCANLCKLPYINSPKLSSPRERVARCEYFLQALGQRAGLRGWYAKVLSVGGGGGGDVGVIRVGDEVAPALL